MSVDAVRDSSRLPPLGQLNSDLRLSRRAVSSRWLIALFILAVASALLILGALRTLGAHAHFAVAPALFRRAAAVVAPRSDRLALARRRSKGISTTRIEQLDDKGSGTKPFTHVIARLGGELLLPITASNVDGHPVTKLMPESGIGLPREILQGSSVAPDSSGRATAYASDVSGVDTSVIEGEAVNSSVIVKKTRGTASLPRIVVAKPADTLPQILHALGAAARDVDAISALLVPTGWFKTKAFAGGEKITVVTGDDPDHPQPELHPLKGSVERPGASPISVARSDDGHFVPVASRVVADQTSSSMSADDATPLHSTSDGSLRESLYAMASANKIDHALIDGMVRLCARDIDLDTSLTGNDTAELLYGANDLGEPELAFAALTVNGHTRRYYRFTASDDGSTDYYDADGHSVTQSLLRKPVAAGRLGDGFGWRIHPVLGNRRLHEGVDYAAPFGSPIVAAGAGVVEVISEQTGYGKYIRIRHDLGYETTYAHISAVARSLHVGSRVHQGETIAFVGSTGYSTGPHLYYELRINGRNVDPLRVHLRAGRVLDGPVLAAFQSTRDRADLLLKTSMTGGDRG
jgi:murein DD-endopeptidase MepM/ murein hydrolase activator NlpD